MENDTNKLIVVLGMHRSGTSAITRGLQVLGVSLGDNLMAPVPGNNEKGFWEDMDINALNIEILHSINNERHFLTPIHNEWHFLTPIQPDDVEMLWQQGFHLRAVELLRKKMSNVNIFGFKDPRTAKLLPFWNAVFEHCQFETHYVIALRHPLSVCKSLAKRDGFDFERGYLLWLEHVINSFIYTEGKSHVVVDYDRLMQSPDTELARVAKEFQLQIDNQELEKFNAEFLDNELRHTVYQINDLRLDEAAPPLVLEVYTKALEIAADDSRLDEAEFKKIIEQWGREFSRLKSALVLVDKIGSRLSEHKQSVLSLSVQVTEKDHQIANQEQIISKLTVQVAERDHQIAERDHQIAEKDHQIAEKDQKVQEYIAWIANRDQVIQKLTIQVTEITSSIAWKIIQLLWRVRVFVAPNGSTRERIGRLVIRSFQVWRAEGFFNLLRKIYSKLKNARNSMQNTPHTKGVSLASKTHSPVSENTTSIFSKAYLSILQTAQNNIDNNYIPLSNEHYDLQDSPVKLIAFYLPQFHPIPENDQWWGKGFTEWSNVSKAVPQFMGHYQPHLPGELGFYDLRVPDVQRRQVELAKQYGLSGFCFYFYWFNGKRLLERPLDQFTSDPEIDFPFCLCWANENWTRRWDGLESDILIAQEHSAENDQAFIQDIEPYLRHKNYIRVDDKPLLIVYRTELMPDPAGTAERWRKYCKESGIGDIYLVASQAFGSLDPRRIGFDAAIEFPPNNMGINDITGSMTIFNPEYSGRVYRYANAVEHMLRIPSPSYKLFKTVFPSWDNEPRKPGRGFSFAFSSPSLYKHWLIGAGRFALEDPHPDKRLVFINAWNEWGEGAHLEPDRKYGYAYLQATADALRSVQGVNPRNNTLVGMVKRYDTAIILHIYYPELWDEINLYLQNLEGDFDLYISSPDDVELDTDLILQQYPNAYIYRCINQGRDIAPFLDIFKAIYDLDYKYICKIHSKKSVHRVDGAVWRNDIYTKLLGSKKIICKIKKMFDNNENVGLVAPALHVIPSSTYWGSNEEKVKQLAKLANISLGEKFGFVGGSMFWFKSAALYPFTYLPLSTESFDVESGQVDGTLAHAIERFLGLLIQKTGFIMLETDGETVKEVKDNSNFPFAKSG